MQTTELEALLDEAPWSRSQRRGCIAASLALLMAGFNNQLLAFFVVRMAGDLGITMAEVGFAFSIALFGTVVGSLAGGLVADRTGRRQILRVSLIAVALTTAAVAFGRNAIELTLLRFLFGVSLGIVTTCAVILSCELSPRSTRPLAVTLTVIGGSIGSLLAAGVAPMLWEDGARPALIGAGAVSLVVALVLSRMLPESPFFLASRPERWGDLPALGRRLGLSLPDDLTFEQGDAAIEPPPPIGALFGYRFGLDTLGLCGALFFCFVANTLGNQFVTFTSISGGLDSLGRTQAALAYTATGITGAVLAAIAMQRLGSRVTLLTMSGAAVLVLLVAATFMPGMADTAGYIIGFALIGLFVSGLQTSLHVLAANVYPTAIRGTGVGTVETLGRVGSVASAAFTGWIYDLGATPGAYLAWAATMVPAFVSLLFVRRHVLPSAAAYNARYKRLQSRPWAWTGDATAAPMPASAIPSIAVPSPPEPLVRSIRTGECVVVLGSGMSAQAGLPSWSALIDELIHDRLDKALVPQFEALRRTRPIDDVVDALRSQLSGSAITGHLVEEIVTHARPDMTTHMILSGLPLSGAVSLNIDDLAQRAFVNRPGYGPKQSERCLDAVSRNEPFVFMLNGSIGVPEDILLSNQNVKDAVSRNDAFRDLLRRLYYSRSLLFVGVSLEGVENFLRIIDRTAEPSRQHYALVEVNDPTWAPVAHNLQSQFGLTVLPFTPDQRAGAIDRFVRALDARLGVTAAPAQATSRSKITRIELRNIGPFSHCAIDLDTRWSVILGDNGVGKSSVLKAIAVGLCGKAGEPFAERLLKSQATVGEIRLWLGGHEYLTTITRRSGSGVTVTSESGVALERERVLAVGYPALRTVGGKREQAREAMPQRPNPSDLLPLTSEEPDPRLDNIKQWIVRLDHLKSSQSTSAGDRQRYSALYERVFTTLAALTEGVELKPIGVNGNTGEITIGSKDGPIPFENLSQGTLSLIGWTGALMQRLYETAAEGTDPLQAPAIVLVDEIDAHMHPAWQQALVMRLSEMFPNAQFIVTSHSPLVVGGLESRQVHRFERDASGAVQVSQPDYSLKGIGAAGLLTSDLFGLASHLDIETANALNRKRQLTARRLDPAVQPGERSTIDAEIEQLEKQVGFVDATQFVRDPLYQQFVDAMSRIEASAPAGDAAMTLTAEEKQKKAAIAEAVLRDLKGNQADSSQV